MTRSAFEWTCKHFMTLNPIIIHEHTLSKRVERNQFSAVAILSESAHYGVKLVDFTP